MTVALICFGAIFENSARLTGRILANPMLFISSNTIGKSRLILWPGGTVSAAMNKDNAPAIVKTLPMIIFVISSGSVQRVPHHFQKAATATSIAKLTVASTVISQLL